MIKSEKGQSLLEFALLLPILVILLVGIVDFGRILYSYMHMHLATQETVRLGGLGKSDTELVGFVQNYLHIGNAELVEVTIVPSDSSRKSGDYMSVTLTYPVEFITPFISRLFPTPFAIQTESTIRVE